MRLNNPEAAQKNPLISVGRLAFGCAAPALLLALALAQHVDHDVEG